MTYFKPSQELRGRGAGSNPTNRFDTVWYEPVEPSADDFPEEEQSGPTTQFFIDDARSILSKNDSPDIGFSYSINPYRGCEHGCIYCYARPTHEYLGFSSGIDFETKIMVKEKAPELLRQAFSSRKWEPQCIMLSGNTDCYQPAERRYQLTRRCLEVFLDFRNPVGIVTKNYLITRDIDLLGELAQFQAVCVCISVTSLDPALARRMEPRASTPARRLAAVRKLSEAGVPVGVLVCPVVPGLTDHEMPAIIEAAKAAGAQFAGFNMLRLPHAIKDLFTDWLEEHVPLRKDRVLNKIREMRGGKLYDPDFATRMRGTGIFADQTAAMFRLACKKAGLVGPRVQLTTSHFRRPTKDQATLFD